MPNEENLNIFPYRLPSEMVKFSPPPIGTQTIEPIFCNWSWPVLFPTYVPYCCTLGGNATEKVEPKNVLVTEVIEFAMTNTDLPDMEADIFTASVKKLDALTARDHAKEALEKARNKLEG